MLQSLNQTSRKRSENYRHISLRGKRGRTVPAIIENKLKRLIQLLINYRDNAGVSKQNPYVFGLPSKGSLSKHHNACELIRKFADACGAKYPERLRGTMLRKHLATTSSLWNLGEDQMVLLSNFLGHSVNIHKSHYQLPRKAQEIVYVSQILEEAGGALGKTNA